MNVFEAVKTSINTREAAARYGIEVNRYGKALCPFHNDRHPSLFVDDDHYHCYKRIKGILDRIPPEIIRAYTHRDGKTQEIRHYR